ncbi:uncharacterized protein LOC116245724 [Nymphaea colorata]|nr:uncharacterized protein LOC116245724 [Nymphaea colorata]
MSMAQWQLICLVIAATCVVSTASDAPGVQTDQSAPSTEGAATPPIGDEIVRHIAVMAEAPAAARRLGHHHESSSSAAGGGVILGGLGTAMIIAVVCYVRVTRRESPEENV